MPATSKAFRRAAAIAEHKPDELYPENKGLAKMSKGQLHDFARTPEKSLPEHKKSEKYGRGSMADAHSQHGRHKRGRGDSLHK